MGFWSNIRKLFSRETPDSTSAFSPRTGDSPLLFMGREQSALNIATVYRCVSLLSDSVANLPIQYMRLKDGIFLEEKDRLHYLLTVQPDVSINAFDFWKQVVTNMLLDGNAYIVPVYNKATLKIDRLVLCGRGTVSYDTFNDQYIISDTENGIYGTYPEDRVIHIKNLCLDGKNGLSTLTYARLTTGIASTGDSETLKRFANGGNVKGFVGNGATVRGIGEYQDNQLQQTAESIDERFSRGEHIVSLPGQVDFKPLSMSSTDMQFLESRKFTVREICRFFGVHPSFVFDDTSNNYKSAEMANVAFLSNTLNPILRKIEVELHRKLIAPTLYHKYKFQFDRKGLYACDLESRIKYQAQTIAAGLMTVNEWRREENRPEVEGGDKVLVSANLKGINETSIAVKSAAESGNGGMNSSGNASNENNNEQEE